MICAALPIAEIYLCLIAYNRQNCDRSKVGVHANARDDIIFVGVGGGGHIFWFG